MTHAAKTGTRLLPSLPTRSTVQTCPNSRVRPHLINISRSHLAWSAHRFIAETQPAELHCESFLTKEEGSVAGSAVPHHQYILQMRIGAFDFAAQRQDT